ncbi:MAG: tRNA lysidine(34) synthetase TilS [Chromatiales bacterium]|nr:tRNA lysidine(34) synthetase TilS [Chromatiales bacterium]
MTSDAVRCAAEQATEAALDQALGASAPSGTVWVALSGGPDSVALLLAAVRRRSRGLLPRLRAVHVDHGLQAPSTRWAELCREITRTHRVALRRSRVDARPGPGESPEAAARRARYQALARCLRPGDVMLTGHHRDDQAETVLLQLLRGAGRAGLAAMPPVRALGSGRLVRPFLALARERVRSSLPAALAERLVDDPTNADGVLDRSYLRTVVMPHIEARWPAAPRVIARGAVTAARDARLLDGLGRRDLEAAGDGDGLRCAALLAMDAERAHNALRVWLLDSAGMRAGDRVIARIWWQLVVPPARAVGEVRSGAVRVRRYRDRLEHVVDAPADDRTRLANRTATTPPPPRCWAPPEAIALAHGVLWAEPAHGEGLAAAALAGHRVEIRLRAGGERCRPAGRRHHQRLKVLFQERGVAPWLRPHLPLVYVGDEIAAVADLWVCAGFVAATGEPGWRLRWRPGEAVGC